MFTVLNVECWEPKGSLRIWGRFLHNSMKYYYADNKNFKIGYLDYVARNGRVNWKKIGKRISKEGGKVVYSGKEEVDPSADFVPFVPVELRQRLCTNMALEVLDIMESVPKELRVGLYDPTGDFASFVPFLLKYTDNMVVVTKNMKMYSAMAEEIISETGAMLRPVRCISALGSCGFIIAPAVIKERFFPMPKAVVLTSVCPKVSLPCSVYYKYSFRLPKELDSLRPQGTDAESFGGALYSLCNVYSIGSLVPFVCANHADSQTTLSLKKYFEEKFGT
ncbi:MAG: hypothetical protein IKB72_04425 [Ruminococcus sp.]|nr:hypothetical protein [Oscillospiraceae bacterium]MBR2724662.1 hypothetical protein [Ruminococcus sp.]